MARKDSRKMTDRELEKVQGGAGSLGDPAENKSGSQNVPETHAPSTGTADVSE